jgi:hypothetical protein
MGPIFCRQVGGVEVKSRPVALGSGPGHWPSFSSCSRDCASGHHDGHQLSGGKRRIAGIARALLTNSTLVLVDDLIEGIARFVAREIWRILAPERNESIAAIIGFGKDGNLPDK